MKPFVVFVLTLVFAGVAQSQPVFSFPGGFVDWAPLNEMTDVLPDGRLAAAISGAEAGPLGSSQVTVFDPVTGVRTDSKTTPGGNVTLKFIVLGDAIRLAALTNDFGSHYFTVWDLSQQGHLTFRSNTLLNLDPGISTYGSNIVYSPTARTAFVTVTAGNVRLYSVNLDTGAVRQTYITPVGQTLAFFEDGSRRLLAGGFQQTLVFVDCTNPSALIEAGRTTLPTSNSSFGTYQISTVFSADGDHVFAGSGYSMLTAVNTATQQVVGTVNNGRYRVRQLKSFENGSSRTLVMRGLEDGNNALKGFAVIDATNPANPVVVNEMVLGEDIFSLRDFSIAKNGRRIFVGSSGRLRGFRIPSFDLLRETVLPQTFDVLRVQNFGLPGRDRMIAAFLGTPASKIYSVPNLINRRAVIDADGKSEIGYFRPSTGTFSWIRSTDNVPASVTLGQAGDIPVLDDYDGDERSDIAVFRPSEGRWLVIESSTSTVRDMRFGNGSDVPFPGDYDGDGKADPAVLKRFPNRWSVLSSVSGEVTTARALPGFVRPVAGDFDGDGNSEIGSFAGGVWRVGELAGEETSYQYGQRGDIPVPCDFDNDGRTDLAVFVRSNATWRILQSWAGAREVQLGATGDVPVPADYDGDGKCDPATFRPSTGNWLILQSSTNTSRNAFYGTSTDVPLTGTR